jgi:hypothetical protein
VARKINKASLWRACKIALLYSACFLLPALAGVAIAVIGESVPMNSQKELAINLQTVGAVIFGIVGVWIAIIYPRTIEAIAAEHLEVAKKKGDFLRSVMRPLKISAGIFIASLILLPISVVLEANGLDGFTARSSFFLSLSVITALEVIAIILSLRPVWDAEDIMADKLSDRSFEESIMPDAVTSNASEDAPR